MFERLEQLVHKKILPISLLLIGGFLVLTPLITYAQSAGSYVESFLYTIVVAVFGKLAGIGGTLLDFAINKMVIGFGELYTDKGLGFTIDSMWVIVRDIFNLTFIFGLVFIGLKMIFGSDSNSRKMLISLILAALLVNFSLFITKFVVDFSNIAAVQLVNTFPKGADGEADISASFMAIMGAPTLFEGKAAMFDSMKGGAGFMYIFGTLMVLLVMTFVFLAGAILLIIRFAVLNIYMLLSPIMFIGMVFPQAAGTAKEFWSGFMGKAFFAPAYILMLYLSYKILAGFTLTGGSSFAKAFADGKTADVEAVFPPFILTTVFLIASIVVAQKMGATGANTAMAAGNYLKGKAKRVAADKTIGVATRGASRILNSDTVTRANARLNTAPGLAGWAARTAVAVGSMGALSKRNRQAVIQGSKSWSVAGSQSQAAREKEDRDIRTTDAKVLAAAKTQQTIDAGMNTAQQLADIRARVAASTASPADLAALPGLEKIEQDMISAIAGLAVSDLEKLSAKDWAKYAPHLTPSQVKSVMNSDNIDQQSKNSIIGARQAAITAVVGSTGAIVTKELTKLTIDQIETMGDQWIKDNVHLFSSQQMEKLKNSDKFGDGQKATYQATRSSKHKANAQTGTMAQRRDLFKNSDGSDRKPEDVASLGFDVFFTAPGVVNTAVLPFLTKEVLEVIVKDKTLGTSQRNDLKAAILSHPTAGPRLSPFFATPFVVNNW
jgi:hypothetical protein